MHAKRREEKDQPRMNTDLRGWIPWSGASLARPIGRVGETGKGRAKGPSRRVRPDPFDGSVASPESNGLTGQAIQRGRWSHA
jgi:hypothetical protein